MAVGDSSVSICSDALILLGASPISSFTEGTDAALACDRLYPDLRDSIISNYMWTWSLKKTQIARLAEAPTNEWKYAYQLPGDMLSGVIALFTSSGTINSLPTTVGKYTVIRYIRTLTLYILITRQRY